MPPTLPPFSADAIEAVPLPDDPFEADPISLRLDAIDAVLAGMSEGLLATIAMLDSFAQRAEPLLVEVERKVARRGKLFGGTGGQ